MRVAIIPARGGSKRIPRKNIRTFGGLPMIAHSIRAARESACFDRIIVSTDDAEIAEVSRQYGAETPFFRPAELANDYAGTTAVVAHAVSWLTSQNAPPGLTCCLYATAPFVRAEDIRAGVGIFGQDRWRYVFSASTYDFPVFRGFTAEVDTGLAMIFPEHANTRSQDLPEAFHDAGQFYIADAVTWARQDPIFDAHSTFVRLPRWRVQDIDTEEDWVRAEHMYQALAGQQ